MTSQGWKYSKDGSLFGPVSVRELAALIGSGALRTDDSVWGPDLESWQPVDAVAKEIIAAAKLPPAPPPLPAAAAPAPKSPVALPKAAVTLPRAPVALPRAAVASAPIAPVAGPLPSAAALTPKAIAAPPKAPIAPPRIGKPVKTDDAAAEPLPEPDEPEAVADWKYSRSGQIGGPVSQDRIGEMIRGGELNSDDQVWHHSLGAWQPVSEVRGSFAEAPARKAPAAPASPVGATPPPLPAATGPPVSPVASIRALWSSRRTFCIVAAAGAAVLLLLLAIVAVVIVKRAWRHAVEPVAAIQGKTGGTPIAASKGAPAAPAPLAHPPAAQHPAPAGAIVAPRPAFVASFTTPMPAPSASKVPQRSVVAPASDSRLTSTGSAHATARPAPSAQVAGNTPPAQGPPTEESHAWLYHVPMVTRWTVTHSDLRRVASVKPAATEPNLKITPRQGVPAGAGIRLDVAVVEPVTHDEHVQLRISIDPDAGKFTVDWFQASGGRKAFALQLLDSKGKIVGQAQVALVSADPRVAALLDADRELRFAQTALAAATGKRDAADRFRNQSVAAQRQYSADLDRAKTPADRTDLLAKLRASFRTIKAQTVTFNAASAEADDAQRQLDAATSTRDRAEEACTESLGDGPP